MANNKFFEVRFLNSIIATAAKHRLAAIYGYRPFVTNGGLLSYGADPIDIHRRAASYMSHPQGRKAKRTSGAAASQVRTRD
jgi:hypothetical protein